MPITTNPIPIPPKINTLSGRLKLRNEAKDRMGSHHVSGAVRNISNAKQDNDHPAFYSQAWYQPAERFINPLPQLIAISGLFLFHTNQ
jgi:hypothetical protein